MIADGHPAERLGGPGRYEIEARLFQIQPDGAVKHVGNPPNQDKAAAHA